MTKLLPMILLALLALPPGAGLCKPKDKDKIQTPVKQAISIQQKSQKQQDKWETEKLALVQTYLQLKQEHAVLEKEHQRLSAESRALAKANRALERQKAEALEIRDNLGPFMEKVYRRLEMLMATDPPFLNEERTGRLTRLKQVLDDPLAPIGEKYRRTLDALFIEAEYGNTIEVYQDKILLTGEEVLGQVFRLGRVSLFFLSLDETAAAYYDVGQQSWELLEPRHLAAIRSARDIGAKRQSAELLPLPLGRLAAPAGGE